MKVLSSVLLCTLLLVRQQQDGIDFTSASPASDVAVAVDESNVEDERQHQQQQVDESTTTALQEDGQDDGTSTEAQVILSEQQESTSTNRKLRGSREQQEEEVKAGSSTSRELEPVEAEQVNLSQEDAVLQGSEEQNERRDQYTTTRYTVPYSNTRSSSLGTSTSAYTIYTDNSKLSTNYGGGTVSGAAINKKNKSTFTSTVSYNNKYSRPSNTINTKTSNQNFVNNKSSVSGSTFSTKNNNPLNGYKSNTGGGGGSCGTSAEAAAVKLTNQKRIANRLDPLGCSGTANRVARQYSALMCQKKCFDHDCDGRNAGARLLAAGYKWQQYAENIGIDCATAQSVVSRWINSPTHRANIMKSGVTEIGVGFYKCPNGQEYWTQILCDAYGTFKI